MNRPPLTNAANPSPRPTITSAPRHRCSVPLAVIALSAVALLPTPPAMAADKFCPTMQTLSDSLRAADGLDTAEAAAATKAIADAMKQAASKAPAKIAKPWKSMAARYARFAVLMTKLESPQAMAEMTKLGKEQMKNSATLNAWTTKNCGFDLFA